jgi:DNA-binding response OmpR family regulator
MAAPTPARVDPDGGGRGTTVLLVEDERSIGQLVRGYLERDGYRVVWVRSGEEAMIELARHPVRMVVLDIGLPGMDGFDVCRRIRSGSSVPIVMLTARDEEPDRVAGLEVGADDYVTKPFSPRELAARVRTVLRRAAPTDERAETLTFGDVRLELATRELRKGDEEVRLTAKEFDLLWFLARHPRRVFSRDQLMSSVWGYAAALDTGTVTVHIRRLREKIEDDPSAPKHLQTVWGVGYRLVP